MAKIPDFVNRAVFVKSWAYFAAAVGFGSIAMFCGRVVYFILSGISDIFAIAGLVYYCVAVSRYATGRREHGIHLGIGTVMIISYCAVIIAGKLIRLAHGPAA